MSMARNIILTLVILLTGCDQATDTTITQPVENQLDPILALVGGSDINRSNYVAMLEKLNVEELGVDKKQIKSKILKGIVRTRALALVAEKELSAAEKLQLNAQVDAYRDELLVKRYISHNIQPKPVTTDMVNDYYQNHIKDYVVEGKLRFEYMVTTSDQIDDNTMNQIITAYGAATGQKNWSQYAADLSNKGLPVQYQSVVAMQPTSINLTLRPHLEKMAVNQVSDLIYGDKIYIAKLTQRNKDNVIPIHKVSAEIRRKLAPKQLKQALVQHIDNALHDVGVEYIK
jgi:hypothetical protein